MGITLLVGRTLVIFLCIPLLFVATLSSAIASIILLSRASVVPWKLTKAIVGSWLSPPVKNQHRHTSLAFNVKHQHPISMWPRSSARPSISTPAYITQQRPTAPSGRKPKQSRSTTSTRDYEGIGGWFTGGHQRSESTQLEPHSRLELPAGRKSRHSHSSSMQELQFFANPSQVNLSQGKILGLSSRSNTSGYFNSAMTTSPVVVHGRGIEYEPVDQRRRSSASSRSSDHVQLKI